MAENPISLAARVTNIRHMGKKLVFYDLKQEGERLQVMCNSANHKSERDFEELQLLSPCLHMLPEAHSGLKDRETRDRKRYLDLIINNKTRETFIMRSKVVSFVRRYLNNLNFVEVETPMMNVIPGGAAARPFMTHHNDLDMKYGQIFQR